MEVVGAVASFIAIGQALVAGRHVIDVLRAIPGIGDELNCLNNEIETLRLIVEEADMRGTSTDQSLPETPLLRRARLQLSEVAAELEVVHRDCVRAVREDGRVKPKKTKWFLQQKRLSECRNKARGAHDNLITALQTLQLRESREIKQHVLRIESITIERHGAMALMSSSLKDFYGSSRQLQGPQVCDMEELHRPLQEKSIDQLTIREAMWEAAIESVDENIEVLQEDMAESPWENSSRWDFLIYDDSDETASETDDESETATVYSDEDEEETVPIEEEEADDQGPD